MSTQTYSQGAHSTLGTLVTKLRLVTHLRGKLCFPWRGCLRAGLGSAASSVLATRDEAQPGTLVTKLRLVTHLWGKLCFPWRGCLRAGLGNAASSVFATRDEAQLRGQVRYQVQLGNEGREGREGGEGGEPG